MSDHGVANASPMRTLCISVERRFRKPAWHALAPVPFPSHLQSESGVLWCRLNLLLLWRREHVPTTVCVELVLLLARHRHRSLGRHLPVRRGRLRQLQQRRLLLVRWRQHRSRPHPHSLAQSQLGLRRRLFRLPQVWWRQRHSIRHSHPMTGLSLRNRIRCSCLHSRLHGESA